MDLALLEVSDTLVEPIFMGSLVQREMVSIKGAH